MDKRMKYTYVAAVVAAVAMTASAWFAGTAVAASGGATSPTPGTVSVTVTTPTVAQMVCVTVDGGAPGTQVSQW